MKLAIAGDMTIDSQPRRGIFLSGSEWEIKDVLHRVGVAAEAYVIPGPQDDPETETEKD